MAAIGPGIIAAGFDAYFSSQRKSALIFKVPGTPVDAPAFEIDATSILETSMKATATKFPVDGGLNISDHVQPDPLTLSVKGIISESPNSFLLTLATSILQGGLASAGLTGASATFATAALSAGVSVATSLGGTAKILDPSYAVLLNPAQRGLFTSSTEYPKKAMQGLESMFRQGVPFTFRTYFSEELYQNMVMTSLSFTQQSNTGDSLMFDMTCQKVEVVKSLLGIASEVASKQKAGSSAPKPKAEPPKTPVKKSEKVPADDKTFAQYLFGTGG